MNGTLIPAYGRDYTSKKDALAAWNRGDDFTLNTPVQAGYINRAEAETRNLLSFQIRWRRLEMVAVIEYKPNKGEWR